MFLSVVACVLGPLLVPGFTVRMFLSVVTFVLGPLLVPGFTVMMFSSVVACVLGPLLVPEETEWDVFVAYVYSPVKIVIRLVGTQYSVSTLTELGSLSLIIEGISDVLWS